MPPQYSEIRPVRTFRRGRTLLLLLFFLVFVSSKDVFAQPTRTVVDTAATKPANISSIVRYQDYSRIPPPGEIRPQAYWQLHLSTSTSIPNYRWWSAGERYTAVDPEDAGIRFILASGEVIYGAYTGEDTPGKDRKIDLAVRAGISRQTEWGGLLRASTGFYRGRFRKENIDLTPPPGEIWVIQDDLEITIPVELGFHYTFLQRRRVRPYLGINAIAFMYYKGESSQNFLEGGTGRTGLVNRFSSTEYFPLYPEFSLTAGFQYEISEKISAGMFVWQNFGANILIDAPFGLEVRYSIR